MGTRRTDADTSLIARLQCGDDSAVADLAAAHGQRIFRVALSCLGNHEDAEELAQDVLLVVSRRIHLFRQDSALSSWIHRITVNAALSRLRRTKRRRRVEVGGFAPALADGDQAASIPEPADETPLADAVLVQRELMLQLRDAMRVLPPAVLRCIIARDLQGLSTRAASALLRVKPETVKSRIHRGRRLLRQRLGLGGTSPAELAILSPSGGWFVSEAVERGGPRRPAAGSGPAPQNH